ncbi:MAG: YkgJ family cysteine cluster protein [Mariniblastus sp.]|nr:YkgJ family cysteine cluster protein [Mariniblastus sp.]
MFKRSINHRYDDPVDLIWLNAAADLGLKIERSSEAFASYDGKGTLTIANADDFDADDSLAQMIFHEICHWLVAGRRGKHLADWGLSNIDDRDLIFEYACHRLQAALSAPYGLREFMAVTTDWRPYWDAIPEEPLRAGDDPAIAIAQEAMHRARLQPFEAVLTRSLTRTATIADLVRETAPKKSLWNLTRPRHRLGSLASTSEDLFCHSCAWAISEESCLRCRQHKAPGEPAPKVNANEQACERWEKKFGIDDCGSCGACCREGFDLVAVATHDPFIKLHPDLVELRDDEYRVPRPEGICVALKGDGTATPYRCRHYGSRPENCADFEVSGDACLLARRRVGLSR